jgi:uncharacterized repeat protein (TIGR01451 family)
VQIRIDAPRLAWIVLLLGSPGFAQNIDTVGGGGPDGVPAIAADVGTSYAIVTDPSGDLYIAAASFNRVFRVGVGGELTLFAGTGGASFSGDGGPARDAGLNFPRGLAVDSAGNLYVSDTNNNRIRRIDAATGTITTVAGSLQGFAGDGGPATAARLRLPHGVFVDAADNLYVADKNNHRVRRVDGATGIINTIAGNGVAGSAGDSGLATLANLNGPAGLALDGAGNLFIADEFNNKVRRVDGATGVITTYAGTGAAAYGGDGGPATLASVRAPRGVDLNAAGDLLIADSANHRVRLVSAATGFIATVAGTGSSGFSGDGGPAIGAALNQPGSVLFDTGGSFYIADTFNFRVRRVDGSAVISTVAGAGSLAVGDGGPATGAQLRLPTGVTSDSGGNLYVADFNHFRIRRIDGATGEITTLAGNGLSGYSGDGGPATAARLRTNDTTNSLALDAAGNLYFSQTDGHRVRRIDASTGFIDTVVGDGVPTFQGDGGSALGASLNFPAGLAFDAAGNLYIADASNHRVRRVDGSSNLITTIAGNGVSGFSGDGIPATSASLNNPTSLAIDGLGRLYICDEDNYRVRMVDLGTGMISTVAGNGVSGFSGDGGPATSANIHAIATGVDPLGNLFLTQATGRRVRWVDAITGTIETVAGSGPAGFGGDGGPAVLAILNRPAGIALDASGNLLLADSSNDRVRRVELSADLGITKDDGRINAPVGGPIEYTIAVTNYGPGTVSKLRVIDNVPAEILLPTFTSSTGAYSSATGEWTGLSLGPTQTVYLTLSGQISGAASGSLVNTATVSPMGGVNDPASGNDTASDIDAVETPADLSLVKSVTPDPAAPGDTLTYTLTVTNSGPAAATNVAVTDALPPDVTFQTVAPAGPTCDHFQGVVSCLFPTIPASQMEVITIDVVANAPGIQVNSASVSADEPETDYTDNQDSASSVVVSTTDAVAVFTVTSTNGTNLLEWMNPSSAAYVSTEILFKTSGFPTGPLDGTSLFNGGASGAKGTYLHTGLTNDMTYYYAAFVHLVGPSVSTGTFTRGRPFDTSGKVKWAYHTGATSMAPPGIGPGAVYEVSNDRAVHAVMRGPFGGSWPTGWVPAVLGAPAQSRPPVVPTGAVSGASRVVFLGAQDGHVYAIDADDGTELWRTAAQLGEMVQAAPAGMFTAFPGGAYDYLFVGTRSSSSANAFVTLAVPDGSIVGTPFDNGAGANSIGIVSSGASVDYATDRVYFTSRSNPAGTNETLWAFDITAAGLSYAWSRALGNIDAAPVLRSGRIYVGTTAGKIHALNAANGADLWAAPFECGDGSPKGFLWPDASSFDLYFSTNGKVWSLSDDGSSVSMNWSVASIPGPSIPLLVPWMHYLYVGSSDGRLYQFDLLTGPIPAVSAILMGDGTGAVGSPSFDVQNLIIYVGSEGGVIYAVEAPF